MAPENQPDELRELDLLTKVSLRIISAPTSPSKTLQDLVTKFLPPILLKLGSPHASVRKQTRQVCNETLTRLRSSTEVGVPVEKLVVLARELGPQGKGSSRDNVALPFRQDVRETALVFIGLGLSRLEWDASVHVGLLGDLLQLPEGWDFDAMTDEDAAKITIRVQTKDMTLESRLWTLGFQFILNVLSAWKLPDRNSADEKQLREGLGWSSSTTRLLSQWLCVFLKADSEVFARSIEFSDERDMESLVTRVTVAQRALLSHWATTRRELIKGITFDQLLSKTRLAAANLLFLDVFSDDERFLPAVVMWADETNLGLFRVADTMFKQCSFDLESITLVDDLLDLYFGKPDPNSDLMWIETQRVNATTPKMQIRILTLLTKSKEATTRVQLIARMVDEQLTQVNDLGREASKLRNGIFTFLNWCERVSPNSEVLAPTILAGFKAFIVNQSWPDTSRTPNGKPLSTVELDMRAKAYENIGVWARKASNTLWDDEMSKLNLLKFLFTSLQCDDASSEIQISIEAALSKLMGHADNSQNQELRSMLMDCMTTKIGDADSGSGYKIVRTSHFAAVRFANRCLPFNDCQARWMDLLAVGTGVSGRPELAEEGSKGLNPHWWSTLQTFGQSELVFPNFEEQVAYIFESERGKALLESSEKSSKQTLAQAVLFCYNILLQQAFSAAAISVPPDSEWERYMQNKITTDDKARDTVRQFINQTNSNLFEPFFTTALECMSFGLARCDEVAVSVSSLLPDSVSEKLLGQARQLIILVDSNNAEIQQSAARILGIFVSHPNFSASLGSDNAQSWIQGLLTEASSWKEAIGQEASKVRGSLICAASVVSNLSLRRIASSSTAQLLSLTTDMLESRDKALRAACHRSLARLFLCVDPELVRPVLSEKVVESLEKDAKAAQESAVAAIGCLIRASEASQSKLVDKAFDALYSLHEVKRPELHFAVGEALSVAAAGWHSKATIADFDLDAPRPAQSVNEKLLLTVLTTVLDGVKTTKPTRRKASAIWLLCIVQFLGEQPTVQSHLRRCQAAFARLLSDRDDVVQEAGSRGLALVYEMGSKSLREDLVRDLVSSFTSGAKMSGTVTADTELFDQGTLPTGEGSITTYQDVVSLATEMGDPSLVYRFMDLASNNAVWNSRSAFGKFGLGSVLAESTYLTDNKKFYPKLYRYRFDPNPNVQRSMNDIWNSVVKDPNDTLTANFDLIMEDLLKSILAGREWRVRQASCAAIADLIQGRQVEQYEKYLDQIWEKAFKVVDDIKETVRAAAMTLCRTLTNLVIRSLEIGDGSSDRARRLMDHAIPFLLQQLESKASGEVQEYAIRTLLKIIKKSPTQAIKPYAPLLIITMVNGLSSFEHEAANYLHLRAAEYGLTAEKLDSMRVSQLTSSPAMQAIERCLEALDDNVEEGMKRLQKCFRTAIGLPSKVGLTSVIVSLVVRHPFKFRPFADRFAVLLRKHLLDRNETITNSNCLALAYLLRLVSDDEVRETSRFVRNLYFESETTLNRQVAGELVLAISKTSNDRLKSFASDFVPLIFIGRNDIDSAIQKSFKAAWDENVAGPRTVALYFDEIIALTHHIESPQWGIKHSVARSVADLITSDTTTDKYSFKQATAIWGPLEKALSGKTWDGKGVVIDGFPLFIKKAECMYDSKSDLFESIALREATRNNAEYREHSIPALGKIAALRQSPAFSQKVLSLAENIVSELIDEMNERMDVDASENKRVLDLEAQRQARLDTSLAQVIECCLKAIILSPDTTQLDQVTQIIATCIPKGAKKCRLATYQGFRNFFDGASLSGITVSEAAKGSLGAVERVLGSAHADQTETIRMAAGQALLAFSKFSAVIGAQTPQIQEALTQWLKAERSSQVREVVRQALNALTRSEG